MIDPESKVYEAGLAEIRSTDGLTISEAIRMLVDLYQRAFYMDAYRINCGDCEEFAVVICDVIAGAELAWGDEFCNEDDDPDQYAYHCVICYNGKFYDSQHPDGVDDFRSISAFQSNTN